MERITQAATTAAAVGCGVTAGILLAFSISVMPALATRPAAEAAATMQHINIAIVSPVFLTVFLGSAVTSITAAIGVLLSGSGSQVLTVGGALLFIVGCVAVTMAINVPLNNTLTAIDSSSPAGMQVWQNYLDEWTLWNHARTVAATAACIVFAIAARRC